MRERRAAGHRLLTGLAVVVVAGAWLFAATRLWRTSVPADLALPSLSPHDHLSPAVLEEAASYTRFLDITELLGSLALLGALGVYAVKGARFARESAAGRIGTGMLLGMLGLAFVWFAQLPFGFAQVWWQRRHDTTDIGYLEWVINDWLTVGAEFLFISLALLIVMALAGVWRRGWWVLAVPALASVALAFAFVQPYLLPGLEQPRDPAIAADARQFASQQGMSKPEVRIQETLDGTDAPNAFAAGLGPSELVVLWDTLVEEFDREETGVVLAHELAHHSRGHIWKGIAWMALLLVPIALLTALATRRRGGLYEPAAVPLAIFVVALLLFLASPLDRELSQRLEAEADWVALETTRDAEAATSLFVEFTRTALIDPDPPAWSDRVVNSHPSIMRRVEMAEAWAARESNPEP